MCSVFSTMTRAGSTTVSTRLIGAEELEALGEQIARVYDAAFGAAPYHEGPSELAGFRERMHRHAAREGFRCVVAELEDELVGFSYGYLSAPGQPWHDAVAAALPPAVAGRWLVDAFELVELAVAPTWQRRGLGTALHSGLLAGLSCSTAVLSVMQGYEPAVRFYRSRGWQELITDFRALGVRWPMVIMGRDLISGGARA